ncbi:SAM-dependent methyltransferase [Mycobacterium crocinum]|uniref:Class I SAM-dependent methyltransferase n=1 Tax=Mycolicibacterium crocinum TaxID=388459 RepID=A0ABY3TJG8_9MYCO|nr:class I SAM-dependent methyltransferase [Mycolicibacterium crocinum]MCV7218398.1 SAM-dependent methyltransferase [Mycolicibacterium crocinum]ULN39901.1 class I SAM-dependent methyltransferase [Mycolicibacterium crocinum]
MRESSIVVRPQPMGSHTYTESSRLQAAGLRTATARFEEAARSIAIPRAPQPIAIADYGAATGYNSLLPIGAAIDIIRKRTRTDHAILVAHTDVPGNDFTTLFSTLADDQDSYLKKDSATYASVVGRSFYSQILPSDSIALGWSSWAIHWLRRVPMPIPDHIEISYSADDDARRAYARQAAEDWRDFIAFRGRELAPGGRLLVLTVGLKPDGTSGFEVAFDAIMTALNQFVADGLITADEVRRMSVPSTGRDEKDFRAPFHPSGRFEGLSIEDIELFNGEDRFWAQYQSDKDAAAFGTNWADFLRGSMFPTLAAAVDTDADAGRGRDRRSKRRREFVDQLHDALAAALTTAPAQMSIPLALVVLEKRRRSA